MYERITGDRLVRAFEQRIPWLMAEVGVPGLSIALVRDAAVVWRGGFGVKRAGSPDPVDDATVFETASLAKPPFAYAVLRLCEVGALDLDIPLTAYHPRPYTAWGFDLAQPDLQRVTARQVRRMPPGSVTTPSRGCSRHRSASTTPSPGGSAGVCSTRPGASASGTGAISAITSRSRSVRGQGGMAWW